MRSFAVRAAAAAGFAVVVGCGSDALIGGTCAPGYAEHGDTCIPIGAQLADAGTVPGTSSDAGSSNTSQGDAAGGADANDAGSNTQADGGAGDASSDGAALDGSSTGSDGAAADGGSDASDDGASDAAATDAATCDLPMLQCGAVCLDVSSDPENCGSCGHVCASNICVAGKCQGATTGDIVYIGHDFIATSPGTAQAKLLTNAILLAPSTPVRVLSYERYADSAAVARLKTIVAAVQVQTGRAVVLTSTSVDADVPAKLDAKAVDVLLVPDQVSAPAGALASLGTSWKTSIAPFTHDGGIFVTLDGASGTAAEMPEFETATGALSVTAHTMMAAGSIVQLVAPNDAVGTAVVSPFATRKSSSHFATEANAGPVVWVVVDAVSSEPHVVHKVAP